MRKKPWRENSKRKKHLRRTVAMVLSLFLCLNLMSVGMLAWADDSTENGSNEPGNDVTEITDPGDDNGIPNDAETNPGDDNNSVISLSGSEEVTNSGDDETEGGSGETDDAEAASGDEITEDGGETDGAEAASGDEITEDGGETDGAEADSGDEITEDGGETDGAEADSGDEITEDGGGETDGAEADSGDEITEDGGGETDGAEADSGDSGDEESGAQDEDDIQTDGTEPAEDDPQDAVNPDEDESASDETDVPSEEDEDEEAPQVTFEWSDDFTACTAIIHRSGQEDVPVACTVTTTGTDVTTTYTATVEVDGVVYTDRAYTDLGTHSSTMWYRFLSDGAIDIRGYRSSDHTVVQTTYRNGGYHTVLVYDDPTADGNEHNFSGIPFTGNGQSYNDGILSVTPNVSFSENGEYTIITYTVTNCTDHAVRYSLGMLADVDIDSDDFASVLVTDTGVHMINQNNNESYYLACRNLSGQDSVDTLWVGQYPEHWRNVFNNQINDVAGIDSAIALSWLNRFIDAGDTTQYHLMVGLGEGTDIQAPETHYHEFGEPVFNWSPNSITCSAAFTCGICNYSRNVDCAISTGNGQFIATASFREKTYTDTMAMTVAFIDGATGGTADIGVHMIGSGDDLTLECSIPLEYFVSVEIDGVLLDTSNYTLASGSTLLTLSSIYLDTLSVGSHDVAMNYSIGDESFGVTTVIEIQRRAIDYAPAAGDPSQFTLDHVPATGDTSHFTLWIMLACISAIGMIIVCKSGNLVTTAHHACLIKNGGTQED